MGLEKLRVLKDVETYLLDSKVKSQFKIWDEQWEKSETKKEKSYNIESNSAVASEASLEAQKCLDDLENILT